MQLPRGTFLEIRKKISIENLIAEMGQKRFTGTGSIFSSPVMATFVFREGTCILIKFRGNGGDAGWTEMQKYTGEVVDIILSSLDEAQLKLAIEFNPLCKIVKAGMISPQHSRRGEKAPAGRTPAAPARQARSTVPAPAVPATSRNVHPEVPSATAVHRREPVTAVPAAAGSPADQEDLESNIDALDSMDLDHVTTRIRSDCKNLIKELQLDYLMER
ncbi:MAG: hypothetical protein WCX22_03815 [Methanoregula sp.]